MMPLLPKRMRRCYRDGHNWIEKEPGQYAPRLVFCTRPWCDEHTFLLPTEKCFRGDHMIAEHYELVKRGTAVYGLDYNIVPVGSCPGPG